ncbi:MAG TPA: response regulator [Polyangiaceae bacterium]
MGSLANVPVLVVDDDEGNRKLVAIVLEAEGAEIEMAGSAEEALSVLSVFRPRVLILDLVLPFMSGLALVERLKAEPLTRDIAVIAVTSFNGPEAVRAARESGCCEYVRKPIDPLSFASVVLRHSGGGT